MFLVLLTTVLLAAQGVFLTVFYDTFNRESLLTTPQYTVNYTGFDQWNVTAGTVDVTVLPNEFIPAPGNYGPGQDADSIVVDLVGSTAQLGAIETKREILFLAGDTYLFSYALGNATETNRVRVEIPGFVDVEHVQSGVTPFATFAHMFTPMTTTYAPIRFTSLGAADFNGLLLDNVAISIIGGTSGAPDPAVDWVRLDSAARGSVRITMSAEASGDAALEVFDVQGRRVAAPNVTPAGTSSFVSTWDTRDVPAGVYFLSARAGGRHATLRFVARP